MAKLEGIIYNNFSGYIVLRGYAPIGDLADISRKSIRYNHTRGFLIIASRTKTV